MSGFDIDLLPVGTSDECPIIDVIVRPSESDIGPTIGMLLDRLCDTGGSTIGSEPVDASMEPGEERYGLRLTLSSDCDPEKVRQVIFERLRQIVRSITVPEGRSIPEAYTVLPLIFKGNRD